MQPPTDNTLPSAPQSSPAMPASPFQPISLEASLETHGNDNVISSPSSHNAAARSSISQADGRTLDKILEDIQTPSTSSTPRTSDRDETLLSMTSQEEEISEPGDEDALPYGEESYEYGNEVDGGYEDEDVSMELSDVERVREADAEESEGDTIEDIMNLPGKVAPAAQAQDFSSFYVHDQSTPDETKEMSLYRASVERELEKQRLEQDCHPTVAAEEDNYDDISILEGVPGEELDVPEDPVFEALQEEIGMRAVKDEDVDTGELETFEGYGNEPSPSIPCSTRARRASEDMLLPDSSFVTFLSNKPAVMQTPSGRHLDFTPNAAISDAPFTKPFNYFNQHKGKENSPSKRRRKASSPEEIAELAREARAEEVEAEENEELKSLEKYREMDLAPLEPVMESNSAGDLITFSTPAKTRDSSLFTGRKDSEKSMQQNFFASRIQCRNTSTLEHEPELVTTTDADSNSGSSAPSSDSQSLPSQQAEDDNKDAEESNSISNLEQKQLILYPQHPAFVNVVSMLPEAMFWATAATIVKYSNKAFDTLIEKLTGLKL